MIFYSFQLSALPGRNGTLVDALDDLDCHLHGSSGYLGRTLLRSEDDPQLYRLDERWASDDDHDRATEALPPNMLAPVLASVDGPVAPTRFMPVSDR